MPAHFLPLAIGYVAATLLRDDDDDCIPFVNPFLVHINANVYEDNVLKFERGEYVAVRAYIIGLESHWLYGTQDGGSFASKFKAEHVTDVGDIGKCGWEYMVSGTAPILYSSVTSNVKEASSSHNRYYVRSTGLQQQELVLVSLTWYPIVD